MKDSFRELMGWDADLKTVENRLRSVKAAALAAPARAFLFNLRAVDNLLLSPFLIAADGVQLFYWTLKYVRAGNMRLISVLNGGMPPEAFASDRAGQITEANSYMRERLDEPGALEEFVEQIDASLRRLIEREDFKTAMRVQLLSSVVLLWMTYETLRNDAHLIGKTYAVPAGMFDLPKSDVDRLSGIKEYRNVIVHRAAVVDDRFVTRVKLQRPGEQLEINSKTASHFFNSVGTIGADMLLALDRHIKNNPLGGNLGTDGTDPAGGPF
jgi:hypothetical protein